MTDPIFACSECNKYCILDSLSTNYTVVGSLPNVIVYVPYSLFVRRVVYAYYLDLFVYDAYGGGSGRPGPAKLSPKLQWTLLQKNLRT